ncbi:hypothetical protein [Capnocytophaga felis]|uniref:DUF5362 domain-containing protein n=1 Tax=Capnocytophaga felis TaxID=2267611 RepID=A0A5M4B7T7_9FLAO|nr:hypothetical protein [Capnocytophaga felis]GET45302.1 hypothetical protein RCZ01_06040 [Capnocytophaga felis]GET47535.1 hypothetical protein RCZ02_03660 [Capnocytophaga felis]
MENQLNSSWGDNKKLEVTPFIKDILSETAKWAKFLAIVGFVGIGFLCLVGIFTLVIGVFHSFGLLTIYLVPVGLMSFIIAFIYFFPIRYLYNFSIKMKNALTLTDDQAFSESFSALKSHYKFVGILMIIVVLIYLINFFMFFLEAIFGETVLL